MDVDEEWAGLVAKIRAAPDPMSCQATGRLWRLALADSRPILASFHGVPPDERDALVSDFFTEKLPSLLAPQVRNPRAYFAGALRRSALDVFRKVRVQRDALDPLTAMAALTQHLSGGEGERGLAIDRARALAALEERDREILLAVFMGEPREEVARFFGTSRANVDQKIARFRKQSREDE